MHRYFLSIRRFSAGIALLIAASLLASGCGGDSSTASAGDVTVETGSLSKAEFVKRADAICAATRSRFTREYTAHVQAAKSRSSQADEDEFLEETIEKIVLPNYEQMVNEIAALGAPSAFVPGVSTFLEALQQRLGEIQAEPKKLIKTAFPFSKAAKLAESAGLSGCAGSLG